MPIRPLRVGLVGAGNIAQIAQLPVLAAAEGVALVGVVTRSRESAARALRRWPIEQAFGSIDDLVDQANLDCVFILTPRTEHAGAVERALSAGVDVFCEKPLADRSSDAHRLADQALDAGRILMVDFNRRYAPAYRAAHDAFAEARVQFCVAQKNRAGSEYRATLENAIHMIDLLRWFCGEPAEVAAHAIAEDRRQEDGLAAMIRFDSGAIATLMAARSAGEWDERFDVYGAQTTARVIAPDAVRITRSGETRLVELAPQAYGWVTATKSLGFEAAVHHFLESVRTREQPLTSGHEAARTQSLVEEVLRVADLPLADDPGRTWQSQAQR